MRLRLWREDIPIEEAFTRLLTSGGDQSVIRELGKSLLYARSFEEYNIEPKSGEDLEKMFSALCERLKLTKPEEVQQWLEKTGQNKATIMKRLSFQDSLQRLKQVIISEEAVKSEFLNRKPRMDRVLFALMRLDNESIAREMYYRVRDDHQDFGLLARQFSQGPEAATGGLIGPKLVNELNPELRKMLAPLQAGEISEPFTLDGKQYLLVQLIRVDSVQFNPNLELSMRDELFEQWTERQLSLAGAALVESGTVEKQVLPEVQAT